MGQRSLGVAQLFLRLLPVLHVHDRSVPFQDAPLFVEQRERRDRAQSVGAISRVKGANLDAVLGAGGDTGHPYWSHPSCVVWVNGLLPTVPHDLFSREAGVLEKAAGAIINNPFLRGA